MEKATLLWVTPQIWSGGKVFEVFDPLPYGCGGASEDYDLVEIEPRDAEIVLGAYLLFLCQY